MHQHLGHFEFGIEVLLTDPERLKKLSGKRVGLLAHPASVNWELKNSLDLLHEHPQIDLTVGFGPQHGIYGEKQDNMVESSDLVHPQLGIPIYSLYSETRRPTREMLDHCDVVLVDLQDVGTRIYTFLTTLLYMMEACSRWDKEIWILDRPNPAGRAIEGMTLRPGWESFVGAGPIIMRHGLTLGEAAKWFEKVFNLSLPLDVVEMKGYEHQWPKERSWVNPSPNAATVNMVRCFPGTVLLEGTELSEGRGTTRPLELFGTPGLPVEKILNVMRSLAPDWMEGVLIRKQYFEPTFHLFAGEICSGIQLHTDCAQYDEQKFRPYRLVSLFLKSLKTVDPDFSIYRHFEYEYEKDRLPFDLINGSDFLRKWIEDSHGEPQDLEKILLDDEKNWAEEVQPYLIYS